jgi:hypothetical protein
VKTSFKGCDEVIATSSTFLLFHNYEYQPLTATTANLDVTEPVVIVTDISGQDNDKLSLGIGTIRVSRQRIGALLFVMLLQAILLVIHLPVVICWCIADIFFPLHTCLPVHHRIPFAYSFYLSTTNPYPAPHQLALRLCHVDFRQQTPENQPTSLVKSPIIQLQNGCSRVTCGSAR